MSLRHCINVATRLLTGKRSTRRVQRCRFRPALEPLEVRAVPAQIDFLHGFAHAPELSFNNGAAISGTRLRLTDGGHDEARSAFTRERHNIDHFHTSFSFQLSPGSASSADGIMFVIQGDSPTARGSAGGELGFGHSPSNPTDPFIPKSVGVKFDLFDNTGEGVNSTGLFVNGQQPSTGGIAPTTGSNNLNGTGIDLHSGHVFDVSLNYDGRNLTVKITDATAHATATQVYAIDIHKTVGSSHGFVGFTGGTGAQVATQEITTWKYESHSVRSP